MSPLVFNIFGRTEDIHSSKSLSQSPVGLSTYDYHDTAGCVFGVLEIKKIAKNMNAKMEAGNAQKRLLPVEIAPVVALMRGLGK